MDYPFVVMTPYYGNHIPRHRQCIDELKARGIKVLDLQDQPYLDIGRSVLCHEAMLQFPNAKALVFVDHDMIFTANDLIGMAERCLKNDLDVTTVCYSMRRPGSILSCAPLVPKKIRFYTPGFEPARFVAMGFTCIQTRVFKRLDESMPLLYCTSSRKDFRPYFERYIKDQTYYPDDIGFSFRVRDLGFKLWIDTEPRIFHRGQYDYAIEDAGIIVPNCEYMDIDFTDSRVLES